MKYSEAQLEQIKHTVPIWQAAQQRISLTRRGKEWWGRCFHGEDTASLSFFQKDGSWIYYCHGCQATGNIFQFVMAFDKVDFATAVETVILMSGNKEWSQAGEKVQKVFNSVVPEKTYLTYTLEQYAPAEKSLEESPDALAWLKSRGITLETAKQFHLGFKQSAKVISPNHPWVDKGWILFPTLRGQKITCVKYRSVQGKKTQDGQPGFLRAPDMETSAYNLDSIIPFGDLMLTEGEPDCQILQQSGFTAIALPGASYSLTPEERNLVMSAPRIFLAGDTDEVGKATMLKLWRELETKKEPKVFMLEWPNAKDANEYYLFNPMDFSEKVESLKQQAIGKPLPSFYNVASSLRFANTTKPFDNPSRLYFPWPAIDKWTPILPGDVIVIFATEPKTGKTDFLKDILLHNAMNHGKVVVNWSAELSPNDYARRVTANLTGHDRTKLEKEDFIEAAKMMEKTGCRFYNGYQPGANFKDLIRWSTTNKNEKIAEGLFVEAKQHLGADIMALDHLHFVIRGERDEIAAQAVAMRSIKDFSIAYGVITIVIVQPRKGLQGSRGRIANSQDAKGSETIGSDSSAVYIMHRNRLSDDNEGSPVFSPETLIKLDYAREGESAKTKLYFLGNQCKFVEMERTFNSMPGGELD